MKDLVTKGTGNSRLLKSSVPAGTTWEEALALLRAGNFPIDLKGLNSAGVSTTGSAYSKANVLPDSLCTSLGITSSTAEPKDAFNALLQKNNTSNTTFQDFLTNDWPYPYKQGVSRPNLLENWYFYGGGSQNGNGQFPVNQKGSTSATSSGYFCDRWRKGNANGTTSLATSGIKLIGDGTNYNYLYQYIEYSNKLYSKQVTASFLNSSGAIASVSTTLPSALPEEQTTYVTSSAIGNVSIQIGATTSYFYVRLRCQATTSTNVVAVKLELGPNQTLARQVGSTWVLNEIPHYATELLKCQRHMVVFNKTNTGSSNSSPTDGIGIGTYMRYGYFYGFIPLPVEMRANPAVSGYICAHYVRETSVADDWFVFDSSDMPQKYIHPNGFSFYSGDTMASGSASNYYNDASILAPYYQGFTLDANL